MRVVATAAMLALTAWGCADGVIQRMPQPPSDAQPDPLAEREADRVTAAPEWAALVDAYRALAQLVPDEDYGRREDAVEAWLSRLVPALQALEEQRALNPLARLDLVVVLEELARARLRVSGRPALSSRQAERWDAASRLLSFADAAGSGRGPTICTAVCDVLLIADLRKFHLVPPCLNSEPDDALLERMPLDARVTVALIARMATAVAPGI